MSVECVRSFTALTLWSRSHRFNTRLKFSISAWLWMTVWRAFWCFFNFKNLSFVSLGVGFCFSPLELRLLPDVVNKINFKRIITEATMFSNDPIYFPKTLQIICPQRIFRKLCKYLNITMYIYIYIYIYVYIFCIVRTGFL